MASDRPMSCAELAFGIIVIVVIGFVSIVSSCLDWLFPEPPESMSYYDTCYTITDVKLRSDTTEKSPSLTVLPYGSELKDCEPVSTQLYAATYTPTSSSKTKGGSKKGYVYQSYIMGQKDFTFMNSIWGTLDSRKAIEDRDDLSTPKFLRAILDYYKEKGYSGKLSAEEKLYVGLKKGAEEWQAFMRPGEVKYGKLVRNAPGIGFLIENAKSGKRKFLYFYLGGGKAKLHSEQDAPKSGSIASIFYDGDEDEMKVEYKKGD